MNEKRQKTLDYKSTATPKATTNDGILVFCAHDDIIPTSRLKENPRNPNKHPEEQIRKLAENIEKLGWRSPITVSNQSGYIVKGHGRLMAAQLKGWSNVPVDYQDYSSMDEEYSDLIADNILAELSEMEKEKVAEILQEYENTDLYELTGYEEEEIDDILSTLLDQEEEEEPEEEEKTVPLTNFTKAGDTWNLGEHRLIVGEDDPVMDDIVSNYVYHTGNLGCTCIRDGKEYEYMELVTTWAAENHMTDEIFKLRKPVLKRK